MTRLYESFFHFQSELEWVMSEEIWTFRKMNKEFMNFSWKMNKGPHLWISQLHFVKINQINYENIYLWWMGKLSGETTLFFPPIFVHFFHLGSILKLKNLSPRWRPYFGWLLSSIEIDQKSQKLFPIVTVLETWMTVYPCINLIVVKFTFIITSKLQKVWCK